MRHMTLAVTLVLAAVCWTTGSDAATTLTLTISEGSVSATCGSQTTTYASSTTVDYPDGATITLKGINTVAGWYFRNWCGDLSGSGTKSLTMNGNKAVTAVFARMTEQKMTTTVEKCGTGTVEFHVGSEVYVKNAGEPFDMSFFTGRSVEIITKPTNGSYSRTYIDGFGPNFHNTFTRTLDPTHILLTTDQPHTVSIAFRGTAPTLTKIHTKIQDGGNGSVNLVIGGKSYTVAAGDNKDLTLDLGQNGTATFTDVGKTFAKWSLDGAPVKYDGTVRFSTDANHDLEVTFRDMSARVVTQPVSRTVSVGQSASFAITAAGAPPLTYQWQKNGTNIAGASLTAYTITAAQTSDAGSYDCVVANGGGSNTSAAATLTVTPPPLTVAINGDAIQLVNEGGPFTLTATVTGGTTPYTYQWQNNGIYILTETTASYSLAAAVESIDEGFYRCVVTDSAATIAKSDLTELLVNGRPRFEVSCAAAGKVLFGFNPNGASIDNTFFSPEVGYDDPTFQLGVSISGMPTFIDKLFAGPFDPYRMNSVKFTLGQTPADGAIWLYAKPGANHWYQKDNIDLWYNGTLIPAGSSNHPLPLLTGPAIPTWSIVAQAGNQSAKVGETVILSLKTDQPYLPLDYQWYYTAVGGTETVITDGVWGYYILENVTAANAGTYRCVITDASGHSVSSNAMTLTAS